MRVNRRPLADLVQDILVLDGHLAPTAPRPTVLPLANAGGVFGSVATLAPRALTVGLHCTPVTQVDRQALLQSLHYRIGRDLLEITTDDLPGQCVRAQLDSVTVELYTGAYATPTCYVQLTFVAADPARIDLEPLLYPLSTAPRAIPVGTATVAPLVWLFGGSPTVVDPVVIQRDHTGAEVLRCTLTASLATNDYLAIDCARHTIARYVAGVLQTGASAGLGAFTGGRYPVLSPHDGVPDAAIWGTLELTATSGTPTGAVALHRRW